MTQAEARPLRHDTIYLNLRSVLQIMAFLSKGVCVPAEHIAAGVAPTTPAPTAGRLTGPDHGRQLLRQAPARRPRDAEVAVRYRGYWFYIAGHDVNSRAVLAILEILYALARGRREHRRPAPDAAGQRLNATRRERSPGWRVVRIGG